MMIRAYDELYLDSAQNILGHAFDFAVMTLDIAPDFFASVFAASDAAKQFAAGNPAYVAGINGCELARLVLERANVSFPEKEDVMYLDRSPEYWSGWALAFYQWYTGYSFSEILTAAPLTVILQMYPRFHEMDLLQFADRMTELMKSSFPETRLKMHRENCGLSQSMLAKKALVPLRQIQLFEQRQRDINKTSALTLLKLSRALRCRMEDLTEAET
ncbi:MAG: helix-turn-helix transcriptional regulator [Lachnospiraceae bacterium]|nr:helix-turn-helix transcriptional regulator [Lachnospiraceae bacterium]